MMLLRYVGALRRSYRMLGPTEFSQFVVRKLASRLSRWVSSTKIDVAKNFGFTADLPFGPVAADEEIDALTVNWFVPDFNIGSGGHINIFRLVRLCELAGFRCRIIIVGKTERKSPSEARRIICEKFSPIDGEVYLGERDLPPAAIAVATSWPTAYAVRNFEGALRKVYFVQDYEPHFYSHGSEYFLALHTYEMGFFGITAGGWLAKKLTADHGMETVSMGFSYDRDLYRQLPRAKDDARRVFFYARPVTPRRGFELGLLALQRVHRLMPQVEFVLAGWDTSEYEIGFPHVNAGTLAMSELAAMYSRCDVALVISSTNLSLLPLELMACGCAVVSNRGANVEWLLNEQNARLVDTTPIALADGVLEVLQDDDLRQRLVANGKTFAQATDWETESNHVIEAFRSLNLRDGER